MKRSDLVSLAVLAIVAVTADSASASTSVKPYVVAVGRRVRGQGALQRRRHGALGQGVGPVPNGRHPGRPRSPRERRRHDDALHEQRVPGRDVCRSRSSGAPRTEARSSRNGSSTRTATRSPGSRAYDMVFQANELVGPAPRGRQLDTSVLSLLLGRARRTAARVRPLDLLHERRGGNARQHVRRQGRTDGRDRRQRACYALPELGRFAWENSLVQPNMGHRTVIMSMEDGPAHSTPVSRTARCTCTSARRPRAGAGVLRRNGLDNGELYVLVPARTVELERGRVLQRHDRSRMGAHPERRRAGRRSARGGERCRRRDPASQAGGRGVQRAQSQRVLVRHDAVRRPGSERARRLYSLRLHPGNVTKGGDADRRLQRRRGHRRGRRHRDQPRQHGHERRVPHDQRGRNGLEPPGDGREGPRRLDLALRHRAAAGSTSPRGVRVAQLDPPGRDGVAGRRGASGRRAASSTCRRSSARTRGSRTSRHIRRLRHPAAPR